MKIIFQILIGSICGLMLSLGIYLTFHNVEVTHKVINYLEKRKLKKEKQKITGEEK